MVAHGGYDVARCVIQKAHVCVLTELQMGVGLLNTVVQERMGA